jgi:glycosyltransferase involved in cell wall biosynthesis
MTETLAPSLPLVAIVTPVRNGEEFFAQTMESVQRQTYSSVLHVLLDNASTDATPDIISRFKGRNIPLAVARNKEPLPMIDNWNRAVGMVPNEASYFIVLCADDVLRPEAIAKLVEVAESDAAIMAVTCNVYRNDEIMDFGWPRDRTVYSGEEVIHRLFRQTPIMDARVAMFRRSALDLHTPFFDPALRTAEDIEAVLRVTARAKLGFVHEPIAMVREYESNTTNAVTRPMGLQFLDHFLVIERYAPTGRGDGSRNSIYWDFRRYYLRRLLIWRWLKGNRQAYDYHIQRLANLEARPRLLEYVDAAIDLILKRSRLRKNIYVFPG